MGGWEWEWEWRVCTKGNRLFLYISGGSGKEKKRLRLLSVNQGRRALAPGDQDTLMVHRLPCSAHRGSGICTPGGGLLWDHCGIMHAWGE
jgi:hypothetical protein